jgi:two-component system, chemotaxis family, response regulator Rcp1
MTEPVDILLVEDNPADVDLVKEGMEDAKILCSLQVAMDGEEALRLLRKSGEFANAARPDIVLLDLNLPKMDGRELLAAIKQDADLKSIPVVILTSSQAETDIIKSYELHANAYISKPVDLRGFSEIVKGLNEFWFAVVKYPEK